MQTIGVEFAKNPRKGTMAACAHNHASRAQPRKPLWNRSKKGRSRLGKFSNKCVFFFMTWRLEMKPLQLWRESWSTVARGHKKKERIENCFSPAVLGHFNQEKASGVRVQVGVFSATRERLLRQRPYMFACAQGERVSISLEQASGCRQLRGCEAFTGALSGAPHLGTARPLCYKCASI